MAVFRIEKTRDYTVMSNHHLRDMSLSLKAKGLLSLMLSLPEDWDYTMKGLAHICKDGIDSISGGIRELEIHGYLIRERIRGANGQLGSIEYTILEKPKLPPPIQGEPIRENPIQAAPMRGEPAQLNKDISSKEKSKKDLSSTDSSNPIPSNAPSREKNGMGTDGMEVRGIYRKIILENIGYDALAQNPKADKGQLDEIVELIRSQVVIATKYGVHHAEDKGLILDSRPEVIRKSVEGSLKRLGTDYIDLYYQHRIDPKVAPEEVAGVMADLIQEGKIRYWGISETTEEYLRRAHAVCPVTAIQNRYSMMARWHESLFPAVEELNIGYVAFSPMANGFLSGQYNQNTKFEAGTDYRSFMPQYTEEGFEKGRELLNYLQKLSEEKQATSAQLSLAWMLGKKKWIIPIPGSRKPERLQENLKAAEIILSAEEINEIDEKTCKIFLYK